MGLRRSVNALAHKGVYFAGRYLKMGEHKISNSAGSEVGGAQTKRKRSGLKSVTGDALRNQKSSGDKVPLRIITLGFLLVLLVVAASFFKKFTGADSPKCRSIYMYPSYARIDGFDERFTKLAKKYHLYLYREQGKDREPLENNLIQLDGVPVLFIPGNAGSFKQARSIAAASADMYFDEPELIDNHWTKNLDFFTADFNEDFTAFHGRSLLDQAEYLNDAIKYILSLYSANEDRTEPQPQSVLVLGHSMGGVVARVMPTLKNFVPESINSYITLSAPHTASPVTFDGDMLKIYESTSKFWKSQFSDNSSFFSQNVSLISITGGVLDTTLPADLTLVEDIIPYSNGFTTYTTTIPQVWTPIDHLAIVWCDQLRKVLAKLLLETVDVHSSYKSRPLKERMRFYRKSLISGLEDYAVQDLKIDDRSESSYKPFELPDDFEEMVTGEKLILTRETAEAHRLLNLFKIPTNKKDYQFSLLTSMAPPEVFFCQNNIVRARIDDKLEDTKFECVSAKDDFTRIPRSTKDSLFPSDSSVGEPMSPFYLLKINGAVLSRFEFVAFSAPEGFVHDDDFLIAEMKATNSTRSLGDNPLTVLLKSLIKRKVRIDTSFLISTISFPNLWSSVISYRLKTTTIGENLIFEPLIRQFIELPFETKWHVNLKQGPQDVNFHNVAPFIPSNSSNDRSLKLDFISPPGCEMTMSLEINWALTMKMLLIRFRLTIAAFTVGLVSLVAFLQYYQYNQTGQFLAFDAALKLLLSKYWVLILALASLLTPLYSFFCLEKLSNITKFADRTRPTMSASHSWASNTFFLGIDELFLWWLGPVFFLMTVSSVYLLFRLITMVEAAARVAFSKVLPFRRTVEVSSIANEASSNRQFNLRQFAGALILVLGVVFYIPYQFAFIILTVVQSLFCLKIAVSAEEGIKRNVVNYNNSVLLLMLLLLPINAPIVMVFMRNFAIRWETPFRSHHNCLAILPIILLIESNARSRIPLRSLTNNLVSLAILGWLLHMSLYSFIFGTRNLYWLHYLFNSLCAMLFLKTFA
ncbi:Bst1p [Lachancea thermotolerans CBS 6340]|uniref:GPI inositol-deacylase n=1 Tax=Lachancea thermotolerans (strain ATCC 56472 / CBS 6340 / NRRL Y-8284) TaxID=559295 RepID=C5DBJ9_LACTC|nr:KLTH0A03234p [Lachancea thermotolerans CBS 6340]CAR21156.1 KLTH0A03234p [Lachancea thermotolerans CBS 6340]